MTSRSKLSRTVMVEHLNLPEDVLMEILSRLRVKDLVRFKSVSKTWLRLISSQHFIQLHLDKSSFRPIRRLSRFYTAPCSRVSDPRRLSFELSGSCDGLVCLINHKHGIVHTWNPATRLRKCIPIKRPPEVASCSWFGHGNKHDDHDFKLVLVTVSSIYLFKLYTVNNDHSCCWPTSTHTLGNFYFTHDYLVATLIDDAVHWLAHPRLDDRAWTRLGPTVILWYDLVKDEVGQIATPPALPADSVNRCTIGQVRGDLCVMFEGRDERYQEVWAMKEYGVQESWTKLFIVPAHAAIYHFSSQRIDDDPELILEDHEMVKSPIYDKKSVRREFGFAGIERWRNAPGWTMHIVFFF